MVQISKPPIPMKLYRHFAVVTLALTAFLALFATGENEELRQQAQSPQSATPSPSASNAPRYGQARMSQANGGGSFGVEASGDDSFGQPGIKGGSDRFINSSNLPAANSENAGFTEAYLDTLSEEELAELLRAMREGGVDDSERRQASAVMEAASRRRSGQGARAD